MAEETYGKKPVWQLVLMYLIVGGIIYALIYYFVIAKSEPAPYVQPESGITGTTGGQEAVSPTGAGTSMTVTLGEQNGSGQSGTALLEESGGKTTLTLTLTGNPADGVSQPAHIHVGACPTPGEVKYPLTPVVNGASVTTLDVTLAGLTAQLPLAVNVHKSATEASVYTSCGDLK